MNIAFKNPKIYLVGGKARHGKDTLSIYLKEEYERNGKKAIITQFSKYIKYYVREMTGWDMSEETKPRELLQLLGTNIIRESLHKDDLFVKRMKDDIEIFSYFYDAIIISDVRIKKEIDDLKLYFPNLIAIHINRPNFDNGLSEEEKKHKTEIDLDDYDKFNFRVENITLEKLKEDVSKIYMNIEK